MAREISRQRLARRGLLTLVVVAVLLTAVSLKGNGTFGSSPHVTADVANAGGSLRKGSDVKMNGAIIGKVAAIRTADDGRGVTLDLEMWSDYLGAVPANVVARILPATVFGTTFVDLVVHGQRTGRLEAGSVVRADRSQGTLELQQALDDIDRLVKALGPADLASAIGSAAQALNGRGDLISRNVREANTYLARINPRMPQVRSDLADLARATDVLDRIAPDLLDASDNVLTTLNTVVTQEASITALIAGGTTLARTGRGFLDANRARLAAFLDGSAILVDAVHDNRRIGIGGSIATNLAVGRVLPTVRQDGFLRSDAILKFDLARPYGPDQRPRYRTGSSDPAGMGAMFGGAR